MHALDEYSPESLDELDDFFEHAPVGLHVGGADGVIRRANRAELHVMGYAECPDEYVGHHVAEFHASEAVIEDMLSRLVGGQQLVNHPATLRRRDGTTLPVRIYSSPRMAGTDFLNTRCLTIPLVDAGQATGAAAPGLRPRPTRLEPVSAWAELHDFFEHAPLGLHVVDAAGIIRRANRVELDTLGYAGAPDEYLGHHIAEFHADQRVIEEMLQTLVGGEPTRLVME